MLYFTVISPTEHLPMKRLYIIRHAKSSWDDLLLKDIDRPLNERGFRDLPVMGKRLKDSHVKVDAIYSSPALRALTTAKSFADSLNYPIADIIIKNNLYDVSVDELVLIVKSFPDTQNTVFLVGHNPELTSFVNRFSPEFIPNIPTCGIVSLDFETDSWSKIPQTKAVLHNFDYPKKNLLLI
jgi:phosphohistidine phosphatase